MINLIVAVDNNLLIGSSKSMPWHIPEDLRHFRDITRGHTVIMGRKTFESIGRPLPQRNNVVLTRKPSQIDGVLVINDLAQYLKTIKNDEQVFIIGGADIYGLAYPFVERLYVTHIAHEFKGDVYFPAQYFAGDFAQVKKQELISSEGIKLEFSVYERIKNN